MDNLRETDYVMRAVEIDNHIQDGISSLDLEYNRANEIFKDYQFYKLAILSCNELQGFLTVKFSTNIIKRHYNDYLIQADSKIVGFMDYLIGLSFYGTTLNNISDYNRKLIKNLFTRRQQWA